MSLFLANIMQFSQLWLNLSEIEGASKDLTGELIGSQCKFLYGNGLY